MKALFFIAKQNMKKKKGDVVVLFFLVTLAALLLYTSLSVFMGMNTVLDDAYNKAHSADFFFMSTVDGEKVAKVLKVQKEVEKYEASDCFYSMSVDYRVGETSEKKQAQFFFGKIEEERSIGKLVGCEDIEVNYNSVVLPYYMKAAEGYEVGDTCYFTFGDTEYEFQVAGFSEDPLFGTPLNISIYGAYMSTERFEDLLEENDTVKMGKSVQHKLRLKEGVNGFTFDKKVSPILANEIPELSECVNWGLNWQTMKGGVAMMSRISMAIVLVFSLLLIVIVLIVIRFSVRNYIEMNMKNVGVLLAAGYTSRQLNFTVLVEMGMISLVSAIAGVALGIGGNRVVGTFQGIMLGIQWDQKFHVGAAALTMVLVLGVVLGVAFISGTIYRRISVLESLRGGIHTHNFKKNYFSFEKSNLPVSLILSGKNILHEKGKNISILCIIMLLSFASCVGFGLYENFALNTDTLLKLVGSEAGNLCITGEGLEDAGKEIELWDEVEKVLYYANYTIQLESETEKTSVVCDTWKAPELVQNEMVISGRLPKYENEIVLTTSIAEELKVDVGDIIYVTGISGRKDYLVCGIDQKIMNMGLRALMNFEGMKRLNEIENSSQALYVYTKEGISFDEISKKVMKQFPEVSVTDSKKQIENVMGGVKLAMVAICIIFGLITILVVAMVEVLLVKTKVIRERKNMGLNKAFGFTTGQLIWQTMMMNLPVISVGAVLGAIMSVYLMEPMIVVCLSFCGIQKCSFGVNLLWMGVTVIGILVVEVFASFLSAVKIRKIEPVKMLVEE